MTCTHLKELYKVCQQHQIRLGSAELIRIVCPQCGVQEVCPSVYTEEYDARHAKGQSAQAVTDEDPPSRK